MPFIKENNYYYYFCIKFINEKNSYNNIYCSGPFKKLEDLNITYKKFIINNPHYKNNLSTIISSNKSYPNIIKEFIATYDAYKLFKK